MKKNVTLRELIGAIKSSNEHFKILYQDVMDYEIFILGDKGEGFPVGYIISPNDLTITLYEHKEEKEK